MLSLPDFEEKQIVLACLSYGDKLSFRNDNLIIKDKEGNIKLQTTCYRLFLLLIVGHISITSGLIQRSKKFNFQIILMTHSLKVYSNWMSKTEGNILLRKKQYKYDDIEIAKHIVKNKIDNQIRMLSKIRRSDDEFKEKIVKMKSYLLRVGENENIKEILGLEGLSARVYFRLMFDNINWKSRKPRTKQDTINTLLDIGYTMLFNFIEALLNVYGFDVYKGVYHKEFYQRKSLVCDIVEPFRVLVDYQLRKAYNLNQIKEEDFYINKNQYFLMGKKAVPYMEIIIEQILRHKQEMFKYVQNYYRAVMKSKRIEEYPVFKI